MEIAKRHAALVKAMVLIAPALEMDNLKQVGIVRGYECSGGGGSMEPSSTNLSLVYINSLAKTNITTGS